MVKSKPYEKLKFYQDICNIRRFVYNLTERFKNTHIRLVSQMRDAARSAKQNIREGYKRGSLAEYIRSIRISQGSLEELSGDIEDCWEDGLIARQEYEYFLTLYHSADYMSTRYIKAMYKLKKENKWKVASHVNATSDNL